MSGSIQRYLRALAQLTLAEFLHRRLLGFLVIVVLVLIAIAEFAASLAVTEAGAIRVAIFGGLVRLLGAALMIAHVAFVSHHDFESRMVDMLTARALPRWCFPVGRIVGFSVIACGFSLVAGLVATGLGAGIGNGVNFAAHLAMELVLVAAISLAVSISFRQTTVSILASVSFYVLARTLATIQILADAGVVSENSPSRHVFRGILEVIGWVVPDFSRFADTTRLDGTATLVPAVGFEFAGFLLLVTCVAVFDFYRHQDA